MKKISLLIVILSLLLITGCQGTDSEKNKTKKESNDIINYKEALQILKEEIEAEVLDIETGITYNVKRVIGGFNTLADVETLTKEDTEKLLMTSGGTWNVKRRAVIVTVGDKKMPASISPVEHSGSEEKPYQETIDNRSGFTGTGINLDSIRDNGMVGVVDIYFYNSLTPGINRVDERHQEMVLKAAEYEK